MSDGQSWQTEVIQVDDFALINVVIEASLKEKLEEEAKARKVSLDNLVEDIFKEYFVFGKVM